MSENLFTSKTKSEVFDFINKRIEKFIEFTGSTWGKGMEILN